MHVHVRHRRDGGVSRLDAGGPRGGGFGEGQGLSQASEEREHEADVCVRLQGPVCRLRREAERLAGVLYPSLLVSRIASYRAVVSVEPPKGAQVSTALRRRRPVGKEPGGLVLRETEPRPEVKHLRAGRDRQRSLLGGLRESRSEEHTSEL